MQLGGDGGSGNRETSSIHQYKKNHIFVRAQYSIFPRNDDGF